jgi:hypothetical protein
MFFMCWSHIMFALGPRGGFCLEEQSLVCMLEALKLNCVVFVVRGLSQQRNSVFLPVYFFETCNYRSQISFGSQ